MADNLPTQCPVCGNTEVSLPYARDAAAAFYDGSAYKPQAIQMYKCKCGMAFAVNDEPPAENKKRGV